jgi:hypothetical protein
MPRKPEIDRPQQLTLTFPTSVYARLRMELNSELEQRVPKGRYQAFFLARLREYWGSESLNLSPYLDLVAPLEVRGSPEAIAALKRRLENAL